MNVEQKVKDIVAGVSGVDVNEVTLQSAVGDFPQWDSMGQMAIIQQVEETFEISFEPEEMMEMEDVNDIIKAVEAKL